MIQRTIKQKILNSLSLKEITIIIGARQTGKTTLLKEIISDLTKKNERVIYFNLDIEEDSKYFQSQRQLLNKIELEIGKETGYVYNEEIQKKENTRKMKIILALKKN